MKMKISLVVLLTALINLNSFGQEKYVKPDYLETYFSWGAIIYSAPTLLLSDAKLLTPNSKILQGDLSNFTRSFGFAGFGNQIGYSTHNPINSSAIGGAVFEAQLGNYNFGKAKDRKRSPQLRVGFGYGSTQSVGGFWSNTSTSPSDTFVSSGGKKIFTDSVSYESVNVSYSSSQARVMADILFHTNPDRRFSIYVGIGLQLGATFNNQTQVYYAASNYITSGKDQNLEVISRGETTSKNEWNNNKGGWLIGAYVPMGVSYRLGKTTNVLNQTSVFMEFKPGITAMAIPELQTYLLPFVQSNYGVRVRF